MWDKLRIRERDRRLGMLFLSILAGVLGFSLLALGFPNAAQVVGILFLSICWLFTVRRLVWLRRKPGKSIAAKRTATTGSTARSSSGTTRATSP